MGITITVAGGFVVMPELFFEYPHQGISLWGNYFPSVIPYTLGLLLSAFSFAYAAYVLPEYPERNGMMRRFLAAIALGLVVILLTPKEANMIVYWAHTFAAVYLFAVAIAGSSWIMLHGGRTPLDWMLFWLLIVGCTLSLFSVSYIGVLGALALGQVLALNAASLIIIRAVLRWSTQEVKE